MNYKKLLTEFDEKFVRSDGLMNKYQNDWSPTEIQTTAEAIKHFLIQSHITRLKEEVEQKRKDLIECEDCENREIHDTNPVNAYILEEIDIKEKEIKELLNNK